jgi:hypothetical protein
MSLFIFLFGSFFVLTNVMSLEEHFGSFIVILVVTYFLIYPALSPFRREKILLDRIGSFGLEINKE